MTLLTIIQDVADELTLQRPTSVIGNTDQTVTQLLALLNREGQNLAKLVNTYGGTWTILEKVHTFTTTSGEDEYALPDDYGWLLSDSVWDRTSFWEMRGPLSPGQWQSFRSGLSSSAAIRRKYRLRRTTTANSKTRSFSIEPEPTATGDTLVFEYATKEWVARSQSSAFDTKFTDDDSDEALLDEDLLEMGLIWRWKKAKGLNFAPDLAEYEIQRDIRMSQDPTSTRLPLAKGRRRFFPGNVPETGFGV
ncbi:MAG: hypothetical protein ACR2P4_08590 [Gammaproteobacteria bacterium]